jgi:hypothetical protein
MKEVYRRCCGLDVHKETVVVCVLPPDGRAGEPVKKIYGTFRADLVRMRVWLKQLRVTEIAIAMGGTASGSRSSCRTGGSMRVSCLRRRYGNCGCCCGAG